MKTFLKQTSLYPLFRETKQFLKKTPLYTFWETNKFWKWTEEDEKRLKFYQQFINPGDLVYDVGANLGNRTKIFLKLQAKVVAFEPQEKCANYLDIVLKNRPNFTLIKKALGSHEGKGEMLISSSTTLSTLSREWLQIVEDSKRYKGATWNQTQMIEITTLDQIIQDFGKPSFVKIDVEGYEFEVLSGLSQSVNYVSIEFASENIQNTFRCIDHLDSILPKAEFQISKSESMVFYLENWVSTSEIKEILLDLVNQTKSAWGDIYIKCLS